MKYKFADLFCGGGGMSIGLVQAGLVDLIASDYWDVAELNYTTYPLLSNSSFYRKNMFIEEDKKELTSIIKNAGIDVLVGGPPCQGFSTLGKREEKDTRNALVDAYLAIALEVHPKMIVMENVPAIQSMKHSSGKKYPEYAKSLLEENNYYAETIFVDGKQVGLSQTRKRMFLLAFNKEDINTIEDFSESLSRKIVELQPASDYTTVFDAIGDLPSLESGEGGEEIYSGDKIIFNHYAFKYETETLKRIKMVPKNGGLQDIPDELLSSHLYKMKHGGYGSGGFVKNLYGRLDWNKPSGTIVAGIRKITGGRFFHPQDNRLLTVREAARLQSFPDDYKVKGSLTEQYTIIGNAVPPKFSEFIGRVMISFYEENKKG